MRLLPLVLILLASCTPPRPTPPDCDQPLSLTCDGRDLIEVDPCTDQRALRSTCPVACHLGACVNCIPEAGLACDGDDLVVTDSCGGTDRVVQTCPNGCADAECIAADCEETNELICVGNLIFSVDSCGNRRDFVRSCPASNPCSEGECEDCFLPEERACIENEIFEFSACGENLGRVAACDTNEVCDGDELSCLPGDVGECVANAGVRCIEGDVRFVDSCGRVQLDVQNDCPFGCDPAVGCLAACPLTVVGQVCLEGNVHALERECPGDLATPSALRETCETGCAAGLCNDEPCAPNAGVRCEGDDLIALDSCGEDGDVVTTCESGCDDGRCI